MNLKEAHDFIDFILQKERGAFLTPPENDEVLDRAQWWLFNQELDYYARNQQIKDSLAIFSTRFQFISTNTGLVQLPTDLSVTPCYNHLLSMYVQYFDNKQQRVRYQPIKFINEDEIAERLNSQILEPTITRPVGMEVQPGVFQLYPAQAISGNGFYLRNPKKPLFAYTLGDDERTITYDPANSVELEWNQASINQILIKALQLAGVNIGDEMIIQYTASKEQQNI